MDNKNKLVGVTASVLMERTLYIEVPEEFTEEQIIETAKKEILLPHTALYSANIALRNVGLKTPGLDLSDWEVTDSEYHINKDD